MNEIELAWAAGFWDGEGSASIHVCNQGKNRYPKLSITQVGEDKELLLRFQVAIGGYGKIYIHTKPTEKHQASWQLVIQNQPQIEKIMKILWPYLSSVKKQQYKKVKASSTYFGGGKHKEYCKNGHKMDEINTKIRYKNNWTLHECRQCNRDAVKRYQNKNQRIAP